MQYDLGLQGLGILLGSALLFGAVVQVIFWISGPRWLWLVASVAYFAGGLLASEVVMGKETTEENIQPLINGLAFDESLLGGILVGIPVALVAWYLARRTRHAETAA